MGKSYSVDMARCLTCTVYINLSGEQVIFVDKEAFNTCSSAFPL